MLAAFYREYDAAAAAAAARPPRWGEAWPSPTAPHEDGSDSLGYKLDRTTGFDALHQKHLRDPTPAGPFDLTKELLLRVVRVGVLSGALGPREMLVLECTHSMFSRHLMEDLARQRIREREALRPGSSERVRARISLRLPERSVAQHSADALRRADDFEPYPPSYSAWKARRAAQWRRVGRLMGRPTPGSPAGRLWAAVTGGAERQVVGSIPTACGR
jgi:hypothetical protein